MSRDRWFKMYPQKYLDDTRELTLEQRGAYMDHICMQMQRDGPLKDDMDWLAHQMHISKRKAKAIIDELLVLQMIRRTPEGLTNDKCEEVIAERRLLQEANAEAAQKREAAKRLQADTEAAVKRVFTESSTPAQCPLNSEPASNRPRPKVEKSKKPSEISAAAASGEQEDSTTRARVDLDLDKKEEETPPTPSGGHDTGANLFGERPPRKKAPFEIAREVDAEVEAAFEVYNLAAEHFQFAACRALTVPRRTRLAKRLREIGGLENFKSALRALSVADQFTTFLRGNAVRPGMEPFRLDIDRLLQTEGKYLGDVLGRLLDLATANAAAKTAKWFEDPAQATPDRWRSEISAHANGTWPPDKLGFWPGHKASRVPDAIVAELDLVDAYDTNGILRKGARPNLPEKSH